MIYDLSYTQIGEVLTVSFNVDNPLPTSADMYVTYRSPIEGVSSVLEQQCSRKLNVPGCDPTATTIEAACLSPGTITPYALVTVYFVSSSDIVANNNVDVPNCCEQPSNTMDNDVIKYQFVIDCECPGIA